MFLERLYSKWYYRKQPEIILDDKPVEIIPYKEDTEAELTLDAALKMFVPDFVPKQKKLFNGGSKRICAYGIALGDISGSRFEGISLDGRDPETIDMFTRFNKFTDDTVLTVAVMKATEELKLIENVSDLDIISTYKKYLREYTSLYPSAGYGGAYIRWAFDEENSDPYNSCGNGSAMRSGIIGTMFDDVKGVIKYSYLSAMPTHNHPEGIKGAIFTAVCVWMVCFGAEKDDIRRYFEKHYPKNNGYKINSGTTLNNLKEMEVAWGALSNICQTTVPEAIINFLESTSFEDCLRNGMRYLCDRDTVSAIAGGIASIYYAPDISVNRISGSEMVKSYLDDKLMLDID